MADPNITHAAHPITISPPETETDIQDITRLFTSYASSLGIDLTFQNFTAELAGLPGAYSPPTGCLLLARDAAREAIGCVALRAHPATAKSMQPIADRRSHFCEMKRLYIHPSARGTGLGRRLVEELLLVAKALGYRAIRLDTLPSMSAARELYLSLGFRPVEAYYDTPIEGTIFLELGLR